MNIYAEKGDKVIVTEETAKYGYEYNQKDVKKYLTIGVPYTVEKTVVGDWSTRVYLFEVPEVAFNSVMFEDYVEDL